jgi:electron transfer flavoprotein beta subunit
MKILTTVKRVIDPDARIKIAGDGQSLATDGVEEKLNAFDEYGVEEAIRLKEAHGGEVVIASVGSSAATKEIRTGLAMGGDRGILVEAQDDELDATIVSLLLAEVIKKEEPDIVLMGKLSVDTENNQVAQRVAELLGWPQATFAYDCKIADGWATVGREVDGGTSTLRVRLPAVISADLRLNDPRYASLPGIMKAKRKPIDTYTPDDLGVDLEPQVQLVGYELPPSRDAGVIVESVDELIDKLQNEAKVF